MSNAVALRSGTAPAPASSADIMEQVIIKGDLSKLSPDERGSYYMAVCKSVGLNPLTKPFDYITLNGKLTLYALRNCTDQLRSIHNISVTDMNEVEREGVCIVTCKVANAQGRTDIAKGAVNLGGLKGEALANAIMKAETKAKRRATLSICGLGLLDETEVEDIPTRNGGGYQQRQNPHVTRAEDVVDAPTGPTIPDGDGTIKALPKGATRAEFERAQKEMYAIDSEAELTAWANANANRFQIFHPDYKEILRGLFAAHKESLKAKKPAEATPADDDVPSDPEKLLKWIDGILAEVKDADMLEQTWNYRVEIYMGKLLPPDQEEALGIYRKHEARLAP